MSKDKFCPAVWLSGFFAMGAVVHFLRAVSGVTLVVGGYEIPVMASAGLVAVFGMLSAGALFLSLKKPCGQSKCSKDGKKEGGCCGNSH